MSLPLRAVLDSFALLSLLKGERGANRVQTYLEAAHRKKLALFLNMINAGEVFYVTYRNEGEMRAFETWGLVKNFPVEIIQNDERLVLEAAHLKGRYPLSYADAFAAATALRNEAVLVTGDPEFRPLSKLFQIDWLR